MYDRFQEQERKDREHFKQLFDKTVSNCKHIYKLEFTDSIYSYYDAIITKFDDEMEPLAQYYVELKSRNFPSDTYSETIMENTKWENIQRQMKLNDNGLSKKLLYIVTFTDDKTYIFNVTDISKYTYGFMNCPKTTMSDNSYVVKKTYYLPLSSGVLLD